MGVVISQDSELGKELKRWDTPRNRPVLDSSGEPVRDAAGLVLMGMNCVGYEEYPKMLYKARTYNGKAYVGMPMPHPMEFQNAAEYERALVWAEGFSKSCQMTVTSAEQERIAKGQGWCVLQDEALAQYEREQQAISNAAAEAAYQAQRMSAKARAEYEAADASTDQQVTDVQPKRKRGRPSKGIEAVSG